MGHAATSTIDTPWAASAEAAAALGISTTSLHRRLTFPHWVEGRHYRWVSKGTRRVLQVNLPEAGQLIRRRGW